MRSAEKTPRQLENIVGGIIEGAYKHIDKPIIVDKNRLWPRMSGLIYSTLQSKPKIICTVRSIPDVISSYILLIERNKDKTTFIDQDLIDANLPINTKNRCRVIWERYVGHPYKSLMMGYNSKNADMLFVEYNDIVNNGQETKKM